MAAALLVKAPLFTLTLQLDLFVLEIQESLLHFTNNSNGGIKLLVCAHLLT